MSLSKIIQAQARDVQSRTLPILMIVGDPNCLNIAGKVLVELELGWEVVFAQTVDEALDIPSARNVDAILLDLGEHPQAGLKLVESLSGFYPHVPIIAMSPPAEVRMALRAVRKGALYHFPRSLLDSEPAAVIETLRSAATEGQLRRQATQHIDNICFAFTLQNDRTVIPAIVQRLTSTTIETGLCDRPTAVRVGVAIEEALINAIIHGNLGLTSELRQVDENIFLREAEARRTQEPYCHRKIRITARISRNEAVIAIQDQGLGFDVANLPDPTDYSKLDHIGGRGILLMRAYMTSVDFNDVGNCVTLAKRRS